MTGWAVIGTGKQVKSEMLPAISISTSSELVAVVGTTTAKAQNLVAGYVGAYGTASLDQVLEDPRVNAIYVGSPNGLHHEHVTAALSAGKHVLSEKPLAIERARAEQLRDLAESLRLHLGVVYQLRNHPAHIRARELFQGGMLGKGIAIRVEYGSATSLGGWRADRELAGAGVLFNIGVHLIDLVRFLTGLEIVEVMAMGERPTPTIDRSCVALFRLESGCLVTFQCSHEAAYPGRTLALYGECGSIHFRDTLHLTGLAVPSQMIVEIRDKPIEHVDFFPAKLLLEHLRSFEDAIAGDHPLCSSAVDGVAGVVVCEALASSMAHRHSVNLDGSTSAVVQPRALS